MLWICFIQGYLYFLWKKKRIMFIDKIHIQAFEPGFHKCRCRAGHHSPHCLLWFGQQRSRLWGGQWGGVGSLSAWVLSNIPLFNQAYCWLALRYTVMRYFFHTLDFALETQGSNKFTVVSDMQFCFVFLFLFLFLFDPRGETDLTAALLF